MVKRKYTYHSKRVRHLSSSRKNKKIGRVIIFLLLICAAVFFVYKGIDKLVSYAYNAESMVVKEIEVIGNKNITKAEIKELLPFSIGDNLLKIDLSEAEDRIKKVKPELKDISINRRWQKVKIKLYERTPEAFVFEENVLMGIDFEDKPFPLRGFMSGMKIPKITYKTQEQRAELLKFIKAFKPVCKDFLDNIAEINFSKTGDLVFKTHDEIVIFWGDDRTELLSYRFDKFEKIYVDALSKHKKIEYVDMTFYNLGKAIVKPKKETI